jgi:hypothetical protein
VIAVLTEVVTAAVVGLVMGRMFYLVFEVDP